MSQEAAQLAREKKFMSTKNWIEGGARPGGGGIGSGLQRLTRGFGMMYMSRLVRLGTNIWKQQHAAAEGFDVASQQAARNIYGQSFGETISPLAYRQQNARIRGGGGIYGQLAGIMTGVD